MIFLRERDQEQAAKRRQRVAKETRRERKTSGYFGLESHFHADDSCQTRQIANKKSDQWQLSKHVLTAAIFLSRGQAKACVNDGRQESRNKNTAL